MAQKHNMSPMYSPSQSTSSFSLHGQEQGEQLQQTQQLQQQQQPEKPDVRNRLDTASTVDTLSVAQSSNSGLSCHDEDVFIHVESHHVLDRVWKDLRKGGYKHTKTVKLTFKTEPTRRLSKMKNLENIFVALGKLPKLEELVITQTALFLPFVAKMLRQTTSLRSVKFHQCKFVMSAKGMRKDSSCNHSVVDKLWSGLERQSHLTTLEILDCTCEQVETSKQIVKFEYALPSFLQYETTKLRRLVLDECVIDGADHSSFCRLLKQQQALEELEIRPCFQVTSERREQYAAKKAATHQFMTQTMPTALATSKLHKVAIAVDDYQLVHVYFDAMLESVNLVQNNNFSLSDLRVSPVLPCTVLGVYVEWETIGIMHDQRGNGVEVFSNDDNSHDKYDIGFHVRRTFASSC